MDSNKCAQEYTAGARGKKQKPSEVQSLCSTHNMCLVESNTCQTKPQQDVPMCPSAAHRCAACLLGGVSDAAAAVHVTMHARQLTAAGLLALWNASPHLLWRTFYQGLPAAIHSESAMHCRAQTKPHRPNHQLRRPVSVPPTGLPTLVDHTRASPITASHSRTGVTAQHTQSHTISVGSLFNTNVNNTTGSRAAMHPTAPSPLTTVNGYTRLQGSPAGRAT
jgi:hypothetical protein